MIGQDLSIRCEFLNAIEKALDEFGVIKVRRRAAHLIENLSQAGATQTTLPTTDIDERDAGFTLVFTKLWSQGVPSIVDRCKSGDNQGKWRRHRAVFTLGLPDGFHAHGVFTHGNGDIQSGA